MRHTVAGDIVKDLLHRFPATPARQLARILYRDNPEAFANPTAAYTAVRYYSGTQGASNRKKINQVDVRPPEVGKNNHDANVFGLPPSDADNWHPEFFPIKQGRGLVYADPHLP